MADLINGSNPPQKLKPISNLMAGLSYGLYPPPKWELKPTSYLMADLSHGLYYTKFTSWINYLELDLLRWPEPHSQPQDCKICFALSIWDYTYRLQHLALGMGYPVIGDHEVCRVNKAVLVAIVIKFRSALVSNSIYTRGAPLSLTISVTNRRPALLLLILGMWWRLLSHIHGRSSTSFLLRNRELNLIRSLRNAGQIVMSLYWEYPSFLLAAQNENWKYIHVLQLPRRNYRSTFIRAIPLHSISIRKFTTLFDPT